MFGQPIKLFKLFGFPIKLDLSWFIIAILITWTLATGLFPMLLPAEASLATSTFWVMGVAGALGLFVSVVLHELGHSLVARRYGLPIRGITLFIFGGVAEMEREPDDAKTEFLVAIAGPLVSVLIALVCFGLTALGRAVGLGLPFVTVVGYLATINTLLVLFNIIPAFPLDGGRVLRSALWHWQGSLRRATRITSWIGAGFGFLLMGLGIFSFIASNFIGGIWWFLIGIFLRNAAVMSYKQLLVRQALEGEPVSRFMITEPVTIPPEISVRELVEEYVYRHYYKLFPVVEDGRLRGCITMDEVKNIEREKWDDYTVGEIADNCTPQNTISAHADALDALGKMSRTSASRLMVVEGDRLLGIIAFKDLMRFFSMKVDMGEEEPLPRKPKQPVSERPDEFNERVGKARQRHAPAER